MPSLEIHNSHLIFFEMIKSFFCQVNNVSDKLTHKLMSKIDTEIIRECSVHETRTIFAIFETFLPFFTSFYQGTEDVSTHRDVIFEYLFLFIFTFQIPVIIVFHSRLIFHVYSIFFLTKRFQSRACINWRKNPRGSEMLSSVPGCSKSD